MTSGIGHLRYVFLLYTRLYGRDRRQPMCPSRKLAYLYAHLPLALVHMIMRGMLKTVVRVLPNEISDLLCTVSINVPVFIDIVDFNSRRIKRQREHPNTTETALTEPESRFLRHHNGV